MFTIWSYGRAWGIIYGFDNMKIFLGRRGMGINLNGQDGDWGNIWSRSHRFHIRATI